MRENHFQEWLPVCVKGALLSFEDEMLAGYKQAVKILQILQSLEKNKGSSFIFIFPMKIFLLWFTIST